VIPLSNFLPSRISWQLYGLYGLCQHTRKKGGEKRWKSGSQVSPFIRADPKGLSWNVRALDDTQGIRLIGAFNAGWIEIGSYRLFPNMHLTIPLEPIRPGQTLSASPRQRSRSVKHYLVSIKTSTKSSPAWSCIKYTLHSFRMQGFLSPQHTAHNQASPFHPRRRPRYPTSYSNI